MKHILMFLLLVFSTTFLFAQGNLAEQERQINNDYNRAIEALQNRLNEAIQEEQRLQAELSRCDPNDINILTGDSRYNRIEKELFVCRSDIESLRSRINGERQKRDVRIQQARDNERIRTQLANEIARKQREQEAQRARAQQAERNRQAQLMQQQRARELEAKREAERRERERRRKEEELARKMKYEKDYNDEIRRTSRYYAGKRSEAEWMASQGALNEMHDNMRQTRLQMSITDVEMSAPQTQVTSSSSVNRLKDRKSKKDNNVYLPEDASSVFDEASVFALTSINNHLATTPPIDDWPYESRTPILLGGSQPLFSLKEENAYYEEIRQRMRDYKYESYDAWGELRNDPQLSEKKLALIRGSLVIANDGVVPSFVQKHENGVLEFGDEDNQFFLASDKSWFVHLKKDEHSMADDNIIKKFTDGDKLYALEGSVDGPGALKASVNKNELSVKKDFSQEDLGLAGKNDPEEYTSLPSPKPETVLGVSGGAKSTIVDNSATYTMAKYWIHGGHVIGVQGKLSGGGKIEASISGKFNMIDMSASGFAAAPKAEVSFSLGLEAVSGEVRVVYNKVNEYDDGYVVSSLQGGGGGGIGYGVKKKMGKEGAEYGTGIFSVKGVLRCRETIVWKQP